MATDLLHAGNRAAGLGAYTAQLSRFARVCAQYCPDPDTLDRIAQIFADAAAEIRAQERH